MREWEYNDPVSPVRFDWAASFDEQVRALKSVDGGSFCMHGQNYYVLRALFEGHIIDDYANPPLDDKGRAVRNVRSRIADLRHKWNIVIGDRQKDGKPYKEYMIGGRNG